MDSIEDFDSDVEADFATKWGSEPREGWTLERETEILTIGPKVFIPDFVFRHSGGRQVMMKVIGFWTLEYLRQKFETLSTFHQHSILLVVAESNKLHFDVHSHSMLFYKRRIQMRQVLGMLASFRAKGSELS